MSLTLSTALRQYMMDLGINSGFDTTGVLELHDGTRPINADTTAAGTNILASINLPTKAFISPSTNGIMQKSAAAWAAAAAAANGTATWFRLKLAADSGTTGTTDRRLDGNVGTAGADLVMSSTSIILGLPVTVNQFTVTTPAS